LPDDQQIVVDAARRKRVLVDRKGGVADHFLDLAFNRNLLSKIGICVAGDVGDRHNLAGRADHCCSGAGFVHRRRTRLIHGRWTGLDHRRRADFNDFFVLGTGAQEHGASQQRTRATKPAAGS
jgi:hypothetical protein